MPARVAKPLTQQRKLQHLRCPLPAGEGNLVRGALLISLIAIAACATVTRAPVSPLPTLQTGQAAQTALTQAPCTEQRFEGDEFTVCPYEPAHQELRLVSKDASGDYVRTFNALGLALGSAASRVAFAMNAGMFEDSGAPVGLYIGNGEQQHRLVTNSGQGNFYLKPNGVFFVDTQGEAHVATTESYSARGAGSASRWATQSGPMLVIDNALNPHFQTDGPSRNIRNGVGVTASGATYFAISQAPVSFGKFARLFRDALNCPNALYFDGSVSSLWAPSLGREDHGRALGPMIVVLETAPALTQ